MCKKEFEVIASALRSAKANELVIGLMALTLELHYPRFNKALFVAACRGCND